jgi:hypothetical protein
MGTPFGKKDFFGGYIYQNFPLRNSDKKFLCALCAFAVIIFDRRLLLLVSA